MIAQVLHCTNIERLFDITHLFESSRLFRKPWQQNPAVAIASLIIHAYKRQLVLTAKNADVAPTTVGVTYLRFMTNVKHDTCGLYAHHRHIRAWQQNPTIHKSLFCRGQTLNFVECYPGHHKTRFDSCAQM